VIKVAGVVNYNCGITTNGIKRANRVQETHPDDGGGRRDLVEVQVEGGLRRLPGPAVSAAYFSSSPFCSLQFYLPDEAVITKDFLKAVLAGRKQLFKKSEVKEIAVPFYDELSVKALYPMFKKDPVFMSYFPEKFSKGKGPPRKYFFDVLNTLHPEYLQQVMAHANKQRMTIEGDKMKTQAIEMSQYWEEQLAAMPYLSCKYIFRITN